MFDDNRYNETDDLLRSILSQGEEDVPAHVWEGVSSQLDRISTRKTVMLWFRRTAVAAAAAAVVAVGVFTDWTGNGDIVTIPNSNGGMGGMYITREISIISRGVASDNGGWL